MQFRSEAHRLAVKQAFLRITSDNSWSVMREIADEVVYELEQKSLQEDDEELAKTYRHDARGARRFWEKFLKAIEIAKESEGDNFLEVIM